MPEGPRDSEPKNNVVPYEEFKHRLETIKARKLTEKEKAIVAHFDKLLELTKSWDSHRSAMFEDMIATEADFENIRRDFVREGGEPLLGALFSELHTQVERLRGDVVEPGLQDWRRLIDTAFEQLLSALETQLEKPGA